MLPLLSVLLLSASAEALVSRVQPYTCTENIISVPVSAQTTDFKLSAPANQTELTGFATQLDSKTSNVSTEVTGAKITLEATYNIWSEICIPAGFSSGGVLEFAVHGINFDHSYWNFGGEGSEYNYVEAAVEAGHAIFIFDRLGVGKSDKPDGIKDVQTATEVEVSAALVKQLRDNGSSGFTFGKIIGVGHSFGSLNLLGLAVKHGNALDGTILTGFSTYSEGMPATLAGFGLTIASEQNPGRFGNTSFGIVWLKAHRPYELGNLSNSYLATQGINNDQFNFFYYPYFNYTSLVLAENTKATLTLGELLTQGDPLKSNATDYTHPVFVVTGDKDFIFCGGNCYQALDGEPNLLQPSKKLFPASSDFSIHIPENTGHAVNMHYSAPETFVVMQDWIKKRV